MSCNGWQYSRSGRTPCRKRLCSQNSRRPDPWRRSLSSCPWPQLTTCRPPQEQQRAHRWSILVLAGSDAGEIGSGSRQDWDGFEPVILCLHRERKHEKEPKKTRFRDDSGPPYKPAHHLAHPKNAVKRIPEGFVYIGNGPMG